MSALCLVLLAMVVGLPIAWLVSEFLAKPPLRITLGIVTLVTCVVCVAAINDMGTRFNYNSSYGGATKDLIETSLLQIEDGHLPRVLKVLRGLSSQYQPTYENRGNYEDLVAEATARMHGATPIEPGSPWDAPVFNTKTWIGHWEDAAGFWIVINERGNAFQIVRSGYPRMEMQSLSVSDDFRVLKFKEGNRWLHTLTLKSKYEASHEWFDIEKQVVWRTDTMYKLIRASEEQKQMTQQPASVSMVPPRPCLFQRMMARPEKGTGTVAGNVSSRACAVCDGASPLFRAPAFAV